MKEQIEAARAALWEYIRSGNRANRRKAIQALKLVNRAALIFGSEKLSNARPPSNAAPIKYPNAGESPAPEPEEANVVLASNMEPTDQPGPEKPKRGRKAKSE